MSLGLLLDILIAVFGVLAAPLVIQGVTKPKTKTGRAAQVGAGILLVFACVAWWGKTGRDPLQSAFCAMAKTAPSCRSSNQTALDSRKGQIVPSSEPKAPLADIPPRRISPKINNPPLAPATQPTLTNGQVTKKISNGLRVTTAGPIPQIGTHRVSLDLRIRRVHVPEGESEYVTFNDFDYITRSDILGSRHTCTLWPEKYRPRNLGPIRIPEGSEVRRTVVFYCAVTPKENDPYDLVMGIKQNARTTFMTRIALPPVQSAQR